MDASDADPVGKGACDPRSSSSSLRSVAPSSNPVFVYPLPPGCPWFCVSLPPLGCPPGVACPCALRALLRCPHSTPPGSIGSRFVIWVTFFLGGIFDELPILSVRFCGYPTVLSGRILIRTRCPEQVFKVLSRGAVSPPIARQAPGSRFSVGGSYLPLFRLLLCRVRSSFAPSSSRCWFCATNKAGCSADSCLRLVPVAIACAVVWG